MRSAGRATGRPAPDAPRPRSRGRARAATARSPAAATRPSPRADDAKRRGSGMSAARDPHAPVIVVRDVRKAYGDVRAVDGITFDVKAGEVFGLLGPNGA